MAAIGGIMFLLIYNDEVEEMKSATFEAAHKEAIAHLVEWLGEEDEGMAPGKLPDLNELPDDIKIYVNDLYRSLT